MVAKRRRSFHFRLFVKEEYKPLRSVSPLLWGVVSLMLAAQLGFHALQGAPKISSRDLQLSEPWSGNILNMMALGDASVLGRVLMLNLQSFDNQQGVSISFNDIDYDKLGQWLDSIVALDERAEYPHFSAAKIYASVNNKERRIKMVSWVRRHFKDAPNERWEWMAYMTNLAKHILKDDALALEMSREIRELTTQGEVPGWTRQLEVFFLENANEYEASASLLANLLDAGEVTDPVEFSFLLDRLQDIINGMIESGQVRNEAQIDAIEQRIEQLRQKFLQQHGIEQNPQ